MDRDLERGYAARTIPRHGQDGGPFHKPKRDGAWWATACDVALGPVEFVRLDNVLDRGYTLCELCYPPAVGQS